MLEVKNLIHSFKAQKVLDGVELNISRGRIVALLGPSGAGKSTLLDCIAGFIKPDFGEIKIDNADVLSKDTFITPEKRRVGLVFQSPNLFPHLNLIENVSFGLKEDKEKVAKYWLELLDLKNYGEKLPHEISGGEQQRVAIARALAPNPSLCLLDEPFNKLDTYLKKRVRAEVKGFLNSKQCTSIIVTHDLQEALEIGDELVFLSEGKLFHLGCCRDFDLNNLPEDLNHFFQ